jgi:hypothetical protein
LRCWLLEAVDAVAEMKVELKPSYEVVITPLKFARGTPHHKKVRRRLADLFPEWEERLFASTGKPTK